MSELDQNQTTKQDLPAYRAKVWQQHKAWFEYHHRVAGVLEAAVQTARAHPSHVHLVVDMLMVQGLKTHAAVSLLSQHGLLEDTASLARRLMELAIQAGYIGLEAEERERRRRAGRFAAFMWRQLSPEQKARLPSDVRAMWVGFARGYGRYVPRSARRWGPTFFDMFRELGQEDLYRSDYSFLSGLAHGNSDHQIFQFATVPIRLHRDEFVSVLLRYSTRYYLALAFAWNRVFEVLDDNELDRLIAGLDTVSEKS